jgi:hypothetical protein
MGPSKLVKPQLSQTLTKGERPNSNSSPAVQISNSLLSRFGDLSLNLNLNQYLHFLISPL